ncbi:MAG: flavin reductase [Muribaculaceae bacterium]|nr:flavin reductase [Muribaculaceae bacterium]
MDTTVLFKLTYGLYVVGVMDGERPVGCVINTCFQVTSKDPVLAVSLNKDNYTTEVLRRNPRFSLSIVAETTEPLIISTFGFRSGRTDDKYAGFGYTMVDGAPAVNGVFAGRLVLDAFDFVDCGTHDVVLARLVDTVQGDGVPMTYDYYHREIKGKAPKNAPTYVEEAPAETAGEAGESKKYRFECDICGYIVEWDSPELPADFVCPLCGVDVTHFHRI